MSGIPKPQTDVPESVTIKRASSIAIRVKPLDSSKATAAQIVPPTSVDGAPTATPESKKQHVSLLRKPTVKKPQIPVAALPQFNPTKYQKHPNDRIPTQCPAPKWSPLRRSLTQKRSDHSTPEVLEVQSKEPSSPKLFDNVVNRFRKLGIKK